MKAMVTTRTRKRGTKGLPEFATKIRWLRENLRLTQPEFARELKVKRGAVANWEGGVREPRRHNYEALARLATEARLERHKKATQVPLPSETELQELGYFFECQAEEKKPEGLRRWEREQDLSYLQLIRERAASGDSGAKGLLELSKLDVHQLVMRRVDGYLKLGAERATMGEELFRAKVLEIASEDQSIAILRRARVREALDSLKKLQTGPAILKKYLGSRAAEASQVVASPLDPVEIESLVKTAQDLERYLEKKGGRVK